MRVILLFAILGLTLSQIPVTQKAYPKRTQNLELYDSPSEFEEQIVVIEQPPIVVYGMEESDDFDQPPKRQDRRERRWRNEEEDEEPRRHGGRRGRQAWKNQEQSDEEPEQRREYRQKGEKRERNHDRQQKEWKNRENKEWKHEEKEWKHDKKEWKHEKKEWKHKNKEWKRDWEGKNANVTFTEDEWTLLEGEFKRIHDAIQQRDLTKVCPQLLRKTLWRLKEKQERQNAEQSQNQVEIKSAPEAPVVNKTETNSKIIQTSNP